MTDKLSEHTYVGLMDKMMDRFWELAEARKESLAGATIRVVDGEPVMQPLTISDLYAPPPSSEG